MRIKSITLIPVLVTALLLVGIQQSAGSTNSPVNICINKKTGAARAAGQSACKSTESLVAVGLNGSAGVQGLQGPQGPKGETGATGPQGPKGDSGLSFPDTAASFVDPDAPLKFMNQNLTGCVGPDNWIDEGTSSCMIKLGVNDSFTVVSLSGWMTFKFYTENCQNDYSDLSYGLKVLAEHLPVTLKEKGSPPICISVSVGTQGMTYSTG